MASAVVDGWHGDLEAALAEYGRQRDQCAIPLSDANLGIARLDLAAGALGAAWFQMNGLEQALDDPAAVSAKSHPPGRAASVARGLPAVGHPAGEGPSSAGSITANPDRVRR